MLIHLICRMSGGSVLPALMLLKTASPPAMPGVTDLMPVKRQPMRLPTTCIAGRVRGGRFILMRRRRAGTVMDAFLPVSSSNGGASARTRVHGWSATAGLLLNTDRRTIVARNPVPAGNGPDFGLENGNARGSGVPGAKGHLHARRFAGVARAAVDGLHFSGSSSVSSECSVSRMRASGHGSRFNYRNRADGGYPVTGAGLASLPMACNGIQDLQPQPLQVQAYLRCGRRQCDHAGMTG